MKHSELTSDPKTPTDPPTGSIDGAPAPDPVDHDREHGVPPETNDDYDDDEVDHHGADSFPASDPPGGF
jgi:hypothetical protein